MEIRRWLARKLYVRLQTGDAEKTLHVHIGQLSLLPRAGQEMSSTRLCTMARYKLIDLLIDCKLHGKSSDGHCWERSAGYSSELLCLRQA